MYAPLARLKALVVLLGHAAMAEPEPEPCASVVVYPPSESAASEQAQRFALDDIIALVCAESGLSSKPSSAYAPRLDRRAPRGLPGTVYRLRILPLRAENALRQ